jgi:hypothetical protein
MAGKINAGQCGPLAIGIRDLEEPYGMSMC